jgi:hypothetical protein
MAKTSIEKASGGISARSIKEGQLRPVHIDPRAFARYIRYQAGTLVEASTPYAGGDGFIGAPIKDDAVTAPSNLITDINVQMLPGYPQAVPVYLRNTTATAALARLSTSNAGLYLGALAAGEKIDARIGGAAAAGKLCWFNMAAALGKADEAFAFRARVKNFGDWAADDILYIGFGKPAAAATFEAETNVVGFRLQKGAAAEADIFTVTRQASGAVVAADTGLELAVDLNAGLGYKDLEVRLSGRVGTAKVEFRVDGVLVKRATLATLAVGGYAPQLFWIAGGGATFDGPVFESIEIGPLALMDRNL